MTASTCVPQPFIPYIGISMDIQQILRWIAIAIVLIVAGVVLAGILKIAVPLLTVVLRALLVLLIIAIILRFIDAIRQRR